MSALTEQQLAVVHQRDVSVVLSSGAGCGKTQVLTQRYLSHLERDGVEVGQLVAITFTERAARQMRERIRRAIVAHLQAAGPDETSRWEQHLRGLETAQISTIHAFCGTLLRQHAVESGLDPRFDVLEDFLAANLEAEAVTTALQRLLPATSAEAGDLHQLVLLYGWRPVLEGVRQLLRNWDGRGQQAWLGQRPAEIVNDWQQYLRCELLPRYLGWLGSASPKIARSLWLLRQTPCRGPKMAANVQKVLELFERLHQADDLAAAVEQIREAARVQGTEREQAWASAEEYELIQKALRDLREDLPAKLKLFLEPAEKVEEAVATGQRFLRVTAEAARAYQQLKRQHSVVDFQDLLVLARNLLRDHPSVRERLQRRYRFLLIDELQDTDPVQMELVELLCGADLTRGKLFAVGDHAQSIYRFRGAEVELFQELRQRMPLEGRLSLTVNFRSQPAILDFANALLGEASATCGSTLASSSPPFPWLQPHLRQVNPGPCVEFLWSPGDAGTVTDNRRTEADWIARRIAGMVRSGEELVVERREGVERLRAVQPGDVVLLFRAMTHVELYESALREHGLDYYLVGGRAFFAQQEVYDVLNLLRTLENPQDSVSLVGTLRSPFCCLSDEALFILGRHPEGPWSGLQDRDLVARLPLAQRRRAERAAALLKRWRGLKNRLSIAQLLATILNDSAYDAALQFEFLGARKLANLWKLQEMARSFDRTGLFGLADFINRLGELVRQQPREEQAATLPEDANVVRLMSIHQAKGLEFPVVFLPDIAATTAGGRAGLVRWDERLGCVVRAPAEDPPPFADLGLQLWQAAEMIADHQEDLRTLYVACTRAQDYLVLSAALPARFSPTNTWTFQLTGRFDLASGRCLAAGLPPERQPRVRVTTSLPEPPAAVPRSTPRRVVPPPSPELPIPGPHSALVARRHVLTLEQIRAGAVPQWDAEDGSDLPFWPGPRDRQGQAETDLQERLLRAIVRVWDWRDPEGWRGPLQRELAARLEGDETLAREIPPLLERLSAHPLRLELAGARACHREVEFQVSLPASEDSLYDQASLPVGGVIDCLWQDAAGDWHLLAWCRPGGVQDAKEELLTAALALEQHLGIRPVSLGCWQWKTGQFERCPSLSLSPHELLKLLRGTERPRRRVKPA